MRQAKSGLVINKSKIAERGRGNTQMSRTIHGDAVQKLINGRHEARLNYFNVKIIRPLISKRHKIWRRKQKKTNFKLQ